MSHMPHIVAYMLGYMAKYVRPNVTINNNLQFKVTFFKKSDWQKSRLTGVSDHRFEFNIMPFFQKANEIAL